MSPLPPKLQEVVDHHEIRQLLAHYCHGCDRGDAARMGSVYAEDSWDDHGPNKCDGQTFAARMTADILANGTVCSHLLGQSLITIDGDRAGAETYFIATVRNRPGDTVETLHQIGGRFVDRLARRGDSWAVVERTCVREWSASTPVLADWLAGAGFVAPANGADDCAYRALSIRYGEI